MQFPLFRDQSHTKMNGVVQAEAGISTTVDKLLRRFVAANIILLDPGHNISKNV